MSYVPAADRYERMLYRRCGQSGLKLPAISLGLWWNFGHERPLETSQAIVRRAFDLGITHFDLANNYGPPYGSAEENFGALIRTDLGRTATSSSSRRRPATTCGRARTVNGAPASTCSRASTRASRAWASTTSTSSTRIVSTPRHRSRRPWERSTLRYARARRSTWASRRTRRRATREAYAILRDLGTPLLIHQPSYSMLNRWIEPELLDAVGELGIGCIVFSPLAQGMLTDKYLDGVPEGSRASRPSSLSPDLLTEEALREDPSAERDRRVARPDARAAGARVGAARPARDIGDHRRLERAAARGQRRRAREPRLHGRGARRDRPLRDRQRHQHLVQHRATARGNAAARSRRARDGPGGPCCGQRRHTARQLPAARGAVPQSVRVAGSPAAVPARPGRPHLRRARAVRKHEPQ